MRWFKGISSSCFVLVTMLALGTQSAKGNDDDDYGRRLGLYACKEKDRKVHPILCHMVDHVLQHGPQETSRLLNEWAQNHNLLIRPPSLDDSTNDFLHEESMVRRHLTKGKENKSRKNNRRPVVLAHGMGDSCFNDGMQRVVQRTSDLLDNVYTVCIPTASTQGEDTSNGYFLNMDASVDAFASRIFNDTRLMEQGFDAIGFSQGNNIIRGYIAKYNHLVTVHSFLSINGVNAGVGAVPYCRPSLEEKKKIEFSFCDLLMEQASHAAYTTYAQHHSFQANYWRDPRPVEWKNYQTYSQLAIWNNEGSVGVNETLKENWNLTTKFIWVMANQDKMVWPAQGEHWGAANSSATNPFTAPILSMEETPWYRQDLFGLKTAKEKNFFESFDGDHLQFDWKEYDEWITTYF